MGVIQFLYNTTTAGASIRATAQQLTTSGLGTFWQESSGSFVTTAQTFTQRSYQVTEQLPVGNNSVAYFSSTPGALLTYTGKLVVGYHDTAATPTNQLVFSEVKYYQAGEDVSFTIADDSTNAAIPEPFVFTMSRRADGKVVALNNLAVSDVDVVPFAFDIGPLVKDGVVVSTISSIVVSPTGALVVTSKGTHITQAQLTTDGNQLAGVTYSVTCNVLTSDGSTLELNGKIVTSTTP